MTDKMPRLQVTLPPSVFAQLKRVADKREQSLSLCAAIVLEFALDEFEKSDDAKISPSKTSEIDQEEATNQEDGDDG